MDEHRKARALAQIIDGSQCGVSLVRPYRLACFPAQPQESVGEIQSDKAKLLPVAAFGVQYRSPHTVGTVARCAPQYAGVQPFNHSGPRAISRQLVGCVLFRGGGVAVDKRFGHEPGEFSGLRIAFHG
jgi:hypothetical protein